MIEMRENQLVLTFPEVHPKARLTIEFQRTLRIPDDDSDYPLPPGLGRFPLRHVDDFAQRVPRGWFEHGGVMLPMYQSEAMWINFRSARLHEHGVGYPFAVKIATGKVCAVSGEEWSEGLSQSPQDYVVVPDQPWLDGFCVEKGVIRQFVAMPLGAGYSAEEQITGAAEHGGLQIAVHPMKRSAFERHFPKVTHRVMRRRSSMFMEQMTVCASPMTEMALAPGGRMRQEICEDRFDPEDWDRGTQSRCFVHISNSLVWRTITGENPPTTPPTSAEYTAAGLPWFDYYDGDAKALEGTATLGRLRSVKEIGEAKGDVPLPENAPITPEVVVQLRRGLKKHEVREGTL